MKKTLEQQLTDKCQELKIDYEISEDAVWVQIKTHHLFKTNGETWEHCRILDESEAWLEQRQEKKPEKKYNLQTETNIAIRIILKAISEIYEMDDDQTCDNEDCDECYEEINEN